MTTAGSRGNDSEISRYPRNCEKKPSIASQNRLSGPGVRSRSPDESPAAAAHSAVEAVATATGPPAVAGRDHRAG